MLQACHDLDKFGASMVFVIKPDRNLQIPRLRPTFAVPRLTHHTQRGGKLGEDLCENSQPQSGIETERDTTEWQMAAAAG